MGPLKYTYLSTPDFLNAICCICAGDHVAIFAAVTTESFVISKFINFLSVTFSELSQTVGLDYFSV